MTTNPDSPPGSLEPRPELQPGTPTELCVDCLMRPALPAGDLCAECLERLLWQSVQFEHTAGAAVEAMYQRYQHRCKPAISTDEPADPTGDQHEHQARYQA